MDPLCISILVFSEMIGGLETIESDRLLLCLQLSGVKYLEPVEDNCGFFVMRFVEHVALNQNIAFTQQDMMYYTCRLVVDLYIKRRELYDRRLKSYV
ncbi:hypothetical protein MRB53_013061 [Persea americana]|uniref:Uncharacterized protein n=1 Tax=Persea americana TaxID=3435 RepID=A0ACC2K6Z6_PERAE|nr:hypothetical protein MRB53_013061 [Persea americana]